MIETTKSFSVRFSNRNQKPSETAQGYAAELKRLFDKGFPSRDRKTREEDLLRRFLDGLLDERTRHEVEYVKEPRTIDEAVYEVVNYSEMRKKNPNRRSARVCRYSSDEESSDEEGHRVARLPGGAAKSRKVKDDPPAGDALNGGPGEKKDDEVLALKEMMAKMQRDLTKCLQTQGKEKGPKGDDDDQRRWGNNSGRRGGYKGGRGSSPSGQQQAQSLNDGNWRNMSCYRCGQPGHFAKDCLTVFGQMQMVAQSVPVGDARGAVMQAQGNLPPNGNGLAPAATGRPN